MYRIVIRSKSIILNFNSKYEFENYLAEVSGVGVIDTYKNVGGMWVKRCSVLR